ncbi:8-amino-7-oxononanoate synthase [Magnetovibrio sp.]|uniref:8-amino-7-oxononanoate synthase n=1 Tax=Magnetovibrio sp. TaxID=2024836 RepID=UPI002F95E920
MNNPFQDQLNTLSRLEKRRELIPASGIDFSSNDYLGLAGHNAIRHSLIEALQGGLALGSGGSRLLRGNHPEHERLETFAADFFGAQSALFMATGYLANVALFTTLARRGDVIVMDELVHASAKEGIHASPARRAKFTHNDAQACEDAIKRARDTGAANVWIAVESVYSMDGDIAPLTDLIDIADRYDAYLIVDEAHATGVHGPDGKGFSAAFEGRDNVVALHTCGKALGQVGALVTLPTVMKDILINTARSFIYTTAPTPLAAIAVQRALEVVRDEPERRARLHDLIAHAHAAFGVGQTQILPLLVGGDGEALALAKRLQAQGFDIRAIRTPTVPDGTARLRLSVTLNVDSHDIDALAAAYGAAS